jgi:hypothetical protein
MTEMAFKDIFSVYHLIFTLVRIAFGTLALITIPIFIISYPRQNGQPWSIAFQKIVEVLNEAKET